jgi:hypothetical protein
VPLSPREAWISDGRQVLHFRPTVWDRWNQRLEITSGELLPDQPLPLLKKRIELNREETSWASSAVKPWGLGRRSRSKQSTDWSKGRTFHREH